MESRSLPVESVKRAEVGLGKKGYENLSTSHSDVSVSFEKSTPPQATVTGAMTFPPLTYFAR